EFATNARRAVVNGDTEFQTVNAAYVNTLTTTYLRNLADTNSSIALTDPNTYNPYQNAAGGTNPQYTNWEAGLYQALDGAPLVVFITDGDPNTVGTTGSSTANNLPNSDLAASAAVGIMNQLKENGQHVLAIGVGNGVTNTTSFNRLRDLVEPNNPSVWEGGAGSFDIRTTDALKVTDFSALTDALRRVVFSLCAPALTLNKVDGDNAAVANHDFTTTISDVNSGGATKQVDWITPDEQIQTVPTSQTVATNASGSSLFQWNPNTRSDPKPWASTVSFSEVMPPGWTAGWSAGSLPSCSVQRLKTDGTISDFTVTVTPSPMVPTGGQTVVFTFNTNNAAGFDGKIEAGDLVNCTIKNQRPPSLTVTKTTVGGTGSFTFDVTNVATNVGSPITVATATAGTLVTSTSTQLVTGTSYNVTERDAAGWSKGTLTCTKDPAGPAGPAAVDLPFDAEAGAKYNCSITNTKQASLTVTKTSYDGVGTFEFVVTNLPSSPISVTTATVGTPVTSAGHTLTAGTTYTVSESDQAQWVEGSLACTQTLPGGSPTNVGTTFTAAPGADYNCAVTNRKPNITVTKTPVT
ncbi:MAG TPA: hypothetical protein PLV68_06310, partial [Ilumatobacteraceae bacterium]|nr:hypothetical protein [Ilumatobacteraceae bacterium]